MMLSLAPCRLLRAWLASAILSALGCRIGGHLHIFLGFVELILRLFVQPAADEDLDAMMLVNVKSALYGMQAVLPHFRARGRGHIINVSSMLGRIPFAAQRSAYSASKHALNSLTANLRMELRGTPAIHVSSVHPGIVATEFGLNALHGGADSRAFPGAQTALEVAEVIRFATA